jgi:hypothetical protein
MATQIEERNAAIARDTARQHGKIIVDSWLADHKEDYQPSDKNSAIMGDWLKANNREISYENLDAAFVALTAQGISFAPPTGPRVDWQKRHAVDFDGSPESWALLDGYLKRFRMSDDERNLEQAFQAIRGARGPKIFMKSFPVAASQTAASATSDDLDTVAPVPGYMRGLRTSRDIRDLSPEKSREWRRGPDKDAFFRRLETIKQKGL